MQSEREVSGEAWPLEQILAPVKRYWGFETLRPLQEAAIRAGLEQRDSLVVLPTGGGKSLCYQVPAELAQRTDVVVSPLISLMKDQVDALRACGYPAAALHSAVGAGEASQTLRELIAGHLRLLFVAPERLLTPRFLDLAARLPVHAFAIDEAHCISQWGHDFRPEYRQLAELKLRFPRASVHAYTATATERVRADIIAQLRLDEPTVLVGIFDRPNLIYRVVPRLDPHQQTAETLRRHQGEAAIVYCLSRRDTEEMAEQLRLRGFDAAAYHAGLDADARQKTQEAFADEKLDVVAATVAFGMGIDRSDVRCVVHAAMPKSVEHYQQETGRAGRDGLEAECVLLYSAADFLRWEALLQRSTSESDVRPEVVAAGLALAEQMRRFCGTPLCRHKALSEYFGQAYAAENCNACDVCLGEVEGVADATVAAQKILSCIARSGERFGVTHIVDVLAGAQTEAVQRWHHEQLSTYALLKDTPRKLLTSMVYQLIDANLVDRTPGDRPILKLNASSWEVMRGNRTVQMLQPRKAGVQKTHFDAMSWEGVDRSLFDSLRLLRREIAQERDIPPYLIFSDATLRELARHRPASLPAFRQIRGVGDRKLADLGERFVAHIAAHRARSEETPAR